MSYWNDNAPVLDNGYQFDYVPAESGGQWFNKICKLTLMGPDYYGTYDIGLVSATGGDGSFMLDVAHNSNNEVIGMHVEFMSYE